MKEVWKDIPGFEEYYQASTLGRIRSKERFVNYKNKSEALKKSVILSPKESNKGYLEVVLSIEGNYYYKRVHRLVADTFISNPDKLPYINHIDEDKKNNCIDNLEWCTQQYNTSEYYKHRINLYQYGCKGTFIKKWDSLTEAAHYYDCLKSGIQHCCAKKLKTYRGYIWSYNELSKEDIDNILNHNKFKIVQYNLDRDYINSYTSMNEAAAATGVTPSFISMCCAGKRNSKYYIWKKENL